MRPHCIVLIAIALLLHCACSVQAGDAPSITVVASYQHFRRTRIAITAPANLDGQLASICDASGLELGVGRLMTTGTHVVATIVLPMPTPGHPYHDLTCSILGQPATRIDIANADVARHEAFAEAPIQFRQTVFSGNKFPAFDFRDPNLVEDLVGPYTLSATYYDAEFTETAAPTKPGRYGAIVEVHGADGAVTKRFMTLYREDADIHWRELKIDLTGLVLPSALGIDPAILGEYGNEVGEFLKGRLMSGGDDGPPAAQLLAWLHEEKPGSGKVTFRSGPAECDARWWFALRKRLGLVQHRYLSFLPTGYEAGTATYPLLLFLHGSGERGLDIEEVRKHGPHRYLLTHDNPFIIIEPQCDPGQWWHACSVIDLLDEICTKYRVDRERLYLTGLSMGGFGTWATAGEFPERFAAMVPICGRGDPSEALRMKDLPIWAFHGAKDPVVPVKDTQDMVEALRAIGGRVAVTIFPEAQHDSWTEAYNTPALYEWLLKQRLGKPDQAAAPSR
jgi:predicted esterase